VKPPALELLPKPALLIGDERIAMSSGGHAQHIYAATGRPTATFPLAGAAEIDAAVAAAVDGGRQWWGLAPERRRDTLMRLSFLLREHDDELTAISMIDTSTKVRRLGQVCADTVAYNAGWCDKLGGEVVTAGVGSGFDVAFGVPYGVVGVIIPWNGPLLIAANIIAPALAAGNACVVKTSELAPFACQRLGELCLEAGIPPGVVNVVSGGREAGDALVAHPHVGKIHFTGSTRTGRAVAQRAAATLTPVGLELGGKSANLVFADGDLELAARIGLTAAIGLNGQVCTAGTRILVEHSAYDTVLTRLAELMSGVKVGDPTDRATQLGPVISEEAAERIVGIVSTAVGEGAGRLITGGRRLGGELADGFFISPTVLADVAPDSDVAREEIFGPVLTVTPFRDETDAIDIANGTAYGLAGYVQTADAARARRVAAALDVGMVYVNGGVPAHPAGAPFGGVKASGYGRTGGRAGIEEFQQPKNVWMAQ
jgi:aldehyde dehydrogenase (NAD+)